MKWFLEMISQVEKRGIMSIDPDKPGHQLKCAKSGPLFDDFFDYVEKCQPFVFSKDVEFLESPRDLIPRYGLVVDNELDAPFPVFSIESIEGNLSWFKNNPGETIRTLCILASEVSPKQFVYFTLTDYGDDSPPGENLIVWASNAEGETVKHYLRRFEKEKLGLESVLVKLKLGSGKNKRRHEIRKIIHVRPKKQVLADLAAPGTGHKIDWSHRFEVRGHWVRLEPTASGAARLGKDREGNYVVAGFTWRSHHIRGPEHLPLVKKVRVVAEE